MEEGCLDARLKLKQEQSYLSDSKSYLTAKEEKFKKISKINKANRKR